MAKASSEDMHGLFRLAYRLLLMEPRIKAGNALVAPFEGVFGITAVCMLDGAAGEVYSSGSIGGDLESQIRATYAAGQDQDNEGAGVTIRRLVTGDRIIGAIGFQGLENPGLTAEPLTLLAAAVLQRVRRSRELVATAAGEEIGAFRSTTFDVLGAECKRALTTILAATGGFRQAGFLRAEQLEMAKLVEEEAFRLGDVILRLDLIARLYHGEVHLRMETANLTGVLAQAVDQWACNSPEPMVFVSGGETFRVHADLKLIRFALNQVLDSARKVSIPGATVRAEIEAGAESGGRSVAVCISSEGPPIPSHERDRLFDRSYAGDLTSNFAGPILGLYAARKVAVAHGGTLDLDEGRKQTHRIAFRLSLPLVSNESDE